MLSQVYNKFKIFTFIGYLIKRIAQWKGISFSVLEISKITYKQLP